MLRNLLNIYLQKIMFRNRSLFLNVTVLILALAAGVGTIMAVRAADGDTCEGGLKTFFYDGDEDGYGDDTETTTSCTAPVGYVEVGGDCNDDDADVNPGESELCNGLDDNCNGLTDDTLATSTYYYDGDDDNYGDASTSIISCGLAGYVLDNSDCNDANAQLNPGMSELCDGIDNDCDGLIDEEGCIVIATSTYYMDSDGDGYGNSDITIIATNTPEGYVPNNTDCNDSNFAVHPGANEVCDGVDNDCDGTVDEGCFATSTYYRDSDGDTYGNPVDSIVATEVPVGYVSNNNDCNDANADVNPGKTEVCDGIDNDCDGSVDEGLLISYYFDGDNDGYGKASVATTSCATPENYVNNDDDCNDTNADINPGKSEVCGDGFDNNCDGDIDENCNEDDDDCDCACSCSSGCNEAVNHGGFVSCISKWTNLLKNEGEISGREKGKIVSEAAKNKFEFKYEFKGEHEDNDEDNDDSENEDYEHQSNNQKVKAKSVKSNNGKAKGKKK